MSATKQMCREMIDANERQIERLKSHNRTLKARIKEINRKEYDHIPVCTPTSQIRYCYPDGS